jgi:predicted outer membrane repeat protein
LGVAACSAPAYGRAAVFSGNQASDGGAVYVSSSADSAPTVRLTGQSLSDNFASGAESGLGNGGAVLVSGAGLAMQCCVLSGNRARADGGSCWVSQGGLSVASSSLTNSSAGGSGGALLAADTPSNVTVSQSSVAGNVASNGGGVFLRNCSGAVLLSRLTVERNVAVKGNGGGLSVLFASGALRLEYCTLSNNRALFEGAALYLSSTLEAAQDPKFIQSWVRVDYMQMDLPSGNALPYVIQNCSFVSNTALNGNGAIALSGRARMIVDSTGFVGNRAQSGGAFFCRHQAEANLSSVSFQRNSANYGGAIHVQDDCWVGLAGSELVSNSAGVCGGALSLNSTRPVTAGGVVRVMSNSAEQSGGALCIIAKENYTSEVCHRSASAHPIMIQLWPKALVQFQLNSAKGGGGAVFLACVQPGNATLQIWAAQSLNRSSSSGSRRLLQQSGRLPTRDASVSSFFEHDGAGAFCMAQVKSIAAHAVLEMSTSHACRGVLLIYA